MLYILLSGVPPFWAGKANELCLILPSRYSMMLFCLSNNLLIIADCRNREGNI